VRGIERLEPRQLLAGEPVWCGVADAVDGGVHSAEPVAAPAALFGPAASGPSAPEAEPSRAFGDQRVLFIRAQFQDRSFDPADDFSDTVIRARLTEIDTYFRANSFGNLAYPDHLLDIVPAVVTIPRTVAQLNDPFQTPYINDTIHSDARQLAQGSGFVLADYDSIVVLFPDLSDGGRITYGGLATIGGQNVWLHNSISASLWGHELGHNLGAGHAGFWEPNDPWAVISEPTAGQWYEYGNALDLMGDGELDGGDFSAYWKREIGWLQDGTQVIDVTAGGSYDLYALDQGAAAVDRTYALSVSRQDGQVYWLEHRAASGNPSIDSGLIFNWHDTALDSDPALIDLTPQSLPGDYRADQQDAALPVGRTYSDWDAQLHITPVARQASVAGNYLGVVVQRGEFAGNVPPWATLALSAENVSAGESLTLTATVTSGDGDMNVVNWDFGDGTATHSSLSVQHAWSAAGQYPVRVTVSDTKGGLAERMAVVNVGPQSLMAVPQPDRTQVVPAITAGEQYDAAVTSDGDGRLVVVWQSDGEDGSGGGIYGRRMLADGTPVGEPFQVTTTTAGEQQNPDVAVAANGDFVVVWQGAGTGGTGEIYARRFTWDGGPIAEEFRVNTEAFGTQQDPAVSVARDTGDFVVAWSSNVTNRRVRYRRYAANGTARDAQEQIAASGRHHSAVDVAVGAGGDFVLVWDSDTRVEGGDDVDGLAVFAQRFQADGTAATGVLQVNMATAGDQQRPRAAVDGQGAFAVVWESEREDGEGWGVFLRNFAADGSATDSPQQVNQTTAADQSSPAIAIDAQDRRIVSWRDGRENYVSSTDGNNAYRVFAASGVSLTPEYREMGLETDFFSGPDVAALGSPDGFVIVNPEYQGASEVDVRARFYLSASPPSVGADLVSSPQGVDALVDALDNDTSLNGVPTLRGLVRPPGAGTVTIDDHGTPQDPHDDQFRYTPPASFRGTVSFAYEVIDEAGATGLGTVTIMVGVTAPNDPPVAVADQLQAIAGDALLIGDLQLLANDLDPDGDALRVSSLTLPEHGTLQDLGDGTWLYTPNSGFSGDDALTYQLQDDRGSAVTGTVAIHVSSSAPDIRPADLLIYYGWPSVINGAATLDAAAAEFGRYDHVVLGDGLQGADHADRAATIAILNHPATANTVFYGYIDLGVTTQNLSLNEIQNRLQQWRSLGVSGILYDDFGYDFETPRARQNEAVVAAHRWGLPVIANGHVPAEVLGSAVNPTYNANGLPTRLTAGDYYLYESFQVRTGAYEDEVTWQTKARQLEDARRDIGIGVMAVTTPDTDGSFQPAQFDYAWYSALLYGYQAVGWGEHDYGADGNSPWRDRPAIEPGSAFLGPVIAASPEYLRELQAGVLVVNASTHAVRFEADADGDAVSDVVEAAAPNGGDGNGDTIPDAQQPHVASLPNAVDGQYVTWSLPEGLAFRNIVARDPPALPAAPAGLDLPVGLFRIEVGGLSAGTAVVATMRWHAAAEINTAYRLGPIDDPGWQWYPWLYNSTAAAGSRIYADRIEVRWVDGASGDDDGVADGSVLALVAPATTDRPWQNPLLPHDVDNNGKVEALDVLTLINEINAHQARELPRTPGAGEFLPPFLDVNGDGEIAPTDVLIVINYLNNPPAGHSPPEGESPDADTALSFAGQVLQVEPALGTSRGLLHPPQPREPDEPPARDLVRRPKEFVHGLVRITGSVVDDVEEPVVRQLTLAGLSSVIPARASRTKSN
jgi:hypothetical protein